MCCMCVCVTSAVSMHVCVLYLWDSGGLSVAPVLHVCYFYERVNVCLSARLQVRLRCSAVCWCMALYGKVCSMSAQVCVCGQTLGLDCESFRSSACFSTGDVAQSTRCTFSSSESLVFSAFSISVLFSVCNSFSTRQRSAALHSFVFDGGLFNSLQSNWASSCQKSFQKLLNVDVTVVVVEGFWTVASSLSLFYF